MWYSSGRAYASEPQNHCHPRRNTMTSLPSITPPSWLGSTTTMDYKLVDFDRNRTLETTESGIENTSLDLLTTLMSSVLPESSTWSSLLLSTLAENLTTFTNSSDFVYEPSSFDQNLTLEERCDYWKNNETFNCTAEEYMTFMRGPQTLPFVQAIFVSSSRHVEIIELKRLTHTEEFVVGVAKQGLGVNSQWKQCLIAVSFINRVKCGEYNLN